MISSPGGGHDAEVNLRIVALGLLCGCGAAGPGIEPASGPVRGGTPVRIHGEGFRGHGTVVVRFGSETGRGVVIESDRLLRAQTPAMASPQVVDVELEFADGTSFALESAFAYETGQGVVIEASP